ncbi:DUF4435 domain-containing protein [Mesorhizobium sp. M7A.F.Ca.MR.245.00.0.0]|uniref:DUF4435 domain-containing protein n=1 Tax=Mesorhizobium sp. M7A.F.Ca.MR.245.00.0.0 TaxID=2496778 RepID=UPI000FCAE5E0|nr:DUF4435 domain-containing protein [Mesorhizobium sp. M7A.F.Ca.MR.245.00.0.0]RUV23652.1 DUF4435 domain-containing protein [Mesorhizobium sp. M7A.F.Ca.MR.245.00.0.0]RUV53661.1 DUF4435 domain-containing protein [Mesorhizobium sp. M7A.F.Ca.MR.228.00.0.0]
MIYSIQNEQDGASVAAEVVMLKAASDKLSLLVEGPSDFKFFATYISDGNCEIVIGWGRENSLTAMTILNAIPVSGVLCIIDRDFDLFLGNEVDVQNVIVTDDHDIEITMFKSPAVEKLVIELGSAEKSKTRREAGFDIRSDVVAVAYVLGVARLHSIKEGHSLKFDGLKFRYVDKKLTFAVKDMFQEIINHSQKLGVPFEGFLQELESWKKIEHDRLQMCCGHDVSAVLGLAFQSLWGTKNAKDVDAEGIESRLRLAFGIDDFRVSDLYKKIKSWEASNPPYICLGA